MTLFEQMLEEQMAAAKIKYDYEQAQKAAEESAKETINNLNDLIPTLETEG